MPARTYDAWTSISGRCVVDTGIVVPHWYVCVLKSYLQMLFRTCTGVFILRTIGKMTDKPNEKRYASMNRLHCWLLLNIAHTFLLSGTHSTLAEGNLFPMASMLILSKTELPGSTHFQSPKKATPYTLYSRVGLSFDVNLSEEDLKYLFDGNNELQYYTVRMWFLQDSSERHTGYVTWNKYWTTSCISSFTKSVDLLRL